MLKTFHQAKIALGSDVTLVIVADQARQARIDALFNKLWLKIFRFEKQFSRFLPNSELSQVNLNAGLRQSVSSEFAEILRASKTLSNKSNKLFNPFILPALQRAGYVKSFVPGYEADEQLDFTKCRVADIDELELGDNWVTIPYNTALDLGGIGKGFLADKLADMVANEPVEGYWFSLGGDLVGAGHDETGEPWQVEIDNGNEPADAAFSIHTNGSEFAVATSGTQLRAGMHKGKAWHHILNPVNLLPAETDLYLSTVYGLSATEADVFASVSVILDSDRALDFLRKQASVEAAVIQGLDADGRLFYDSFGTAVAIKDAEASNVR